MKKLFVMMMVSLISLSRCAKKEVAYTSEDLDTAVQAAKDAYG